MNIYINNGVDIPNDETCYIIAKGGIYLKKKLDLIESITPVNNISFLEDIPTFAKINISKITTRIFGNILGFFREVYKLYKSEAIVLIYYNKNTKFYKVLAPDQEVSNASLKYEAPPTPKDHILIGTIHSHGNMQAFHSGTDKGDEENFDGIHMTIGKLNAENFFDVCGSIVVNGMRVPIIPENYVHGLERREYTPYFQSMFKPSFEFINNEKHYKNTVKTLEGYVLNGTKEDYDFNKKWLDKVKETVYTRSYDISGGVYVFKHGRLIKEETNKNKQLEIFDFSNSCKEKDKTEFCICKHCIHRDQKLKLEDIKTIEEKDLESKFSYQDFDLFNYEKNWWD